MRSPWAWYPLDGASVGPSSEALDTGNEQCPMLSPSDADATQWSEAPGWWSGNGASRALEATWLAGSPFERVMLPAGNAFLIGVEVSLQTIPTLPECIYQIGLRSPATGLRGLHLVINTIGKPLIRLADDLGNELLIAGKDEVPATNGGDMCIFVYVDQRSHGSRTAAMYMYETGTRIQSSRVENISHMGSITGGDNYTSKVVTIGARRANNGVLQQFFSGRLRGLQVINFGQTPPSNVNDIMAGLSKIGMTAGAFMDGV